MKFDMDSKWWQMITVTCQFIFLNIIFLLLCLPIITIGPALTSLFYVTIRYADHEQGYLIKDFFLQLKEHLLQRSIISSLYLVLLALLSFITVFWFQTATTIGLVFSILLIFLSILTSLAFILYCALSARYQNTWKQTIKNSFLIPFVSPWHSVLLLVIPVGLISLAILSPFFRLFLMIIGVSFACYCSAFCLLSLFRKLY